MRLKTTALAAQIVGIDLVLNIHSGQKINKSQPQVFCLYANIAQDESTSVVFGMPREAILLNAVDRVLPPDRIPDVLLEQLSGS